MLSNFELKEVLKQWDLEQPLKIKDISPELIVDKSPNVWLINEKYLLKVSKNSNSLRNQIEISKTLAHSGLKQAVAIPTITSEDIYTKEDLHFCLLNYLEGEHLKSSDIYENKVGATYLGELMGQLHVTLKKQDKDIVCSEPYMLDTLSNWAIPVVKKHMDLSQQFYEDFVNHFSTLYPKLPKQIIHRDPNPNNIIVKDHAFVGFIDFELSERNIRIFDPCYLATAILSQTFTNEEYNNLNVWIKIYHDIINGYDAICQLSIEEQQAIPDVLIANQLICVAYFSENSEFIKLAKINQDMLYWLIEYRKDLIIKIAPKI